MRPSHAVRAAPAGTGNGSRKFDHIWQAIRAECNRETAKEQITSSPPLEHPLPMVQIALARDRDARFRLGLPLVDHSRRDFAVAITADEFDIARKRRTRR